MPIHNHHLRTYLMSLWMEIISMWVRSILDRTSFVVQNHFEAKHLQLTLMKNKSCLVEKLCWSGFSIGSHAFDFTLNYKIKQTDET